MCVYTNSFAFFGLLNGASARADQWYCKKTGKCKPMYGVPGFEELGITKLQKLALSVFGKFEAHLQKSPITPPLTYNSQVIFLFLFSFLFLFFFVFKATT